MTIIQRYTTTRGRETEPPLGDPAVIIRGGGGLTLRYGEENFAQNLTKLLNSYFKFEPVLTCSLLSFSLDNYHYNC